jgi:hypothetical protein
LDGARGVQHIAAATVGKDGSTAAEISSTRRGVTTRITTRTARGGTISSDNSKGTGQSGAAQRFFTVNGTQERRRSDGEQGKELYGLMLDAAFLVSIVDLSSQILCSIDQSRYARQDVLKAIGQETAPCDGIARGKGQLRTVG